MTKDRKTDKPSSSGEIDLATESVEALGESTHSFFAMAQGWTLGFGDYTLFVAQTLKALRRFFYRWDSFLHQCEFVGVSSMPVVIIASLFMGSVLGYQLYISFQIFGAQAMLGGAVGVSLFREMAPVMASIMVSGRAGAAMAAELSSMKVSEQIDALEVMAIDPIEFLVMPRVVASTLMMPLLAVFFAGVGSLAAEFIGCGVMGLDHAIFWDVYAKWVDSIDLWHITIKSICFGFVFSTIACFHGLKAEGGASAVGYATRSTVVTALLWILATDYLLTSILPYRKALMAIPDLLGR